MEEQNTLKDRIEKLASDEDLNGLESLLQSLDAQAIETHKTELAEAFLMLYGIWYVDLTCDKIRAGDEEGVVAMLLDVLTTVEKIDPEKIQYGPRAECYVYLSDFKSEPDDKLLYIQKAIDEYTRGIREAPTSGLHAHLADTLLSRMAITQHYADSEFAIILSELQAAFSEYTESAHVLFLHDTFKVLNFSFDKSHQWHTTFMNQLESSLSRFAQRDPFLYLAWSDELVRVLEYNHYNLTPKYAAALNKKSIALLEPLMHFETTNVCHLNKLGHSFEKAAQRMSATEIESKLRAYEVAVHYFTEGQSLNLAAWTFPVYATGVQLAMARLYHEQHDVSNVIALFESGRAIFSKTAEHGNDFTLTLNWGRFLIEYARLAYDFNAPHILNEAESTLRIAKELGQHYYSQPYCSLAKVALMQGDKEKCLAILQECKAMFAAQQFEYDFAEVRNDEDFKAIWSDLT